MMKKVGLAFAAATLIFAVAACGKSNNNTVPSAPASPPAAPSGSATTSAADAEAIYKTNCMSCHGVDLGGGVGPSLAKVGARMSVDQIKTQIENATVQNDAKTRRNQRGRSVAKHQKIKGRLKEPALS
jgi:mono/diheme cytochrome c family protein